VDETGTLVITQVLEYADGTYDPLTHIYVDSGPGSARIQLQIGCNINGAYTWPEIFPYIS